METIPTFKMTGRKKIKVPTLPSMDECNISENSGNNHKNLAVFV